jgi:hypothetical protein
MKWRKKEEKQMLLTVAFLALAARAALNRLFNRNLIHSL